MSYKNLPNPETRSLDACTSKQDISLKRKLIRISKIDIKYKNDVNYSEN